MSFAWEIARDSHIGNTISQTMNKHIRPSWMQHEIAPWSSAAKSMVRPGNTKCSMTQRYITSLADTKRYIQRKKERWGIQFCSWLRPREVHVLHAWRDYKLYSLGASRLAPRFARKVCCSCSFSKWKRAANDICYIPTYIRLWDEGRMSSRVWCLESQTTNTSKNN